MPAGADLPLYGTFAVSRSPLLPGAGARPDMAGRPVREPPAGSRVAAVA